MKLSKLAIVPLVAAVSAFAAHAGAEGVTWAPSFNSAAATARTSGKLVMLDFYTDW